MKNLRYILFGGLMCLHLIACNDTYQSSIPNFYVNLRLDLASTYPTFKNNPNHYLVFTKPLYSTDGVGFGGVWFFAVGTIIIMHLTWHAPTKQNKKPLYIPMILDKPFATAAKLFTIFQLELEIRFQALQNRL